MFFYILLLVIGYLIYFYLRDKFVRIPAGLKRVPQVRGKFPLVGHGLEFSKDIIGCVRKWQKEYGNIFQVKIFRTNMIIITDRTLLADFFRARENDISLYKTLNRLFFGDAFTDDENFLSTIIDIVKSTIRVIYSEFIPKIEEEAKKMLFDMKKLNGKKIIISDVMMKFVARTSAKCFLCIDLTDRFYDDLMSFSHLLNRIVILTYFLPKPVLRLVLNPMLRYYRNKMIRQLKPLIQSYRLDLSKKDSLVIRAAVDYRHPVTKQPITDDQISGILICLLYVSTENTALGLSSSVTDLAINTEYWEKVRKASKKYVIEGDFHGLVKSCEIVEACFNESARMNTHVFPLNRYPVNKNMALGEYYVGNVESIGICAPLLMCEDLASDVYTNPTIYRPERFMGDEKESVRNLDLLSFGAFSHLCPGRQFAKLEIKIALALITNMFEPFDLGDNIPENNYFSPSAFAERHTPAILHLRKPLNMTKYVKQNADLIIDNHKIIKLEKGWLIKEYFGVPEQIAIYNYLVDLSKDTVEQSEMPKSNPNFSYPLTYYNLVYTNTSNCVEPVKMFDTAKKIWSLLVDNKTELDFDGDDIFEPNSVYAAMFANDTTMEKHTDKNCDWGISISLGATCKFTYDNQQILLESGDVLIGDFSVVEHSVDCVTNDIPEWFGGDYDDINTFGKTRCSVQIRRVAANKNAITIDAFKDMLVSY